MSDKQPVDHALSCEKWAKNIKEINSVVLIAHVHGMGYFGEPFVFCPWCGNKLVEDLERLL